MKYTTAINTKHQQANIVSDGIKYQYVTTFSTEATEYVIVSDGDIFYCFPSAHIKEDGNLEFTFRISRYSTIWAPTLETCIKAAISYSIHIFMNYHGYSLEDIMKASHEYTTAWRRAQDEYLQGTKA